MNRKKTLAEIKRVLKKEGQVIWDSYQRVLEALARLEEWEELK